MDVKNNTGQYTGSAPFQPSSGKKIKIGLDRQLFHWITSLNLSFCTLSLSLICSECNSLDSLLSSPSGTSLSSTELFNKPPQSNTVYSFPDSQASTRGCSHCKIQGHRCACCACIETHSFMAAARHFHTRHAQNFIKRSRSLGVHVQQEKANSHERHLAANSLQHFGQPVAIAQPNIKQTHDLSLTTTDSFLREVLKTLTEHCNISRSSKLYTAVSPQ